MSNPNCISKRPVVIGAKFGRWTVIDPGKRHGGRSAAMCRCECGTEKVIRTTKLLDETTKSCGCYRAEVATTHGQTTKDGRRLSREYWVWNSMVQRCTNPRCDGYANYGGRGIGVDQAWLRYETFYADMGPRPSSGHSIERIDNDKGYGPDNCIWATRATQNRNRRNTKRITANGETKCLQDWANQIGVSHATIIYRLRKGWTPEAAVTTRRNAVYAGKPAPGKRGQP